MAYNKEAQAKYQKKCKMITFKFFPNSDKDIIDFLESCEEPKATLIKRLIRAEMRAKGLRERETCIGASGATVPRSHSGETAEWVRYDPDNRRRVLCGACHAKYNEADEDVFEMRFCPICGAYLCNNVRDNPQAYLASLGDDSGANEE